MKVGKLNTGRIVMVLKEAQHVQFSPYRHVLVNNHITVRPNRINPYWVLETSVVWVMDFGDSR